MATLDVLDARKRVSADPSAVLVRPKCLGAWQHGPCVGGSLSRSSPTPPSSLSFTPFLHNSQHHSNQHHSMTDAQVAAAWSLLLFSSFSSSLCWFHSPTRAWWCVSPQCKRFLCYNSRESSDDGLRDALGLSTGCIV
ncbi:unnamed protein product [Periconia digitata]|uniref:Uncharacterized protein n=1 Tax=Periconia digitata TaxID=1303443 RepID=A0A9W4XJ94_9PLEO|nr:unnamed protein product [Periconia digitata]